MAISDTGCPSPLSDNRPARLAVITPATPIKPIRPIWLSLKPKGGADSSSAMVENSALTEPNTNPPSSERLRKRGCSAASLSSERSVAP